jgi:hypothetical protein
MTSEQEPLMVGNPSTQEIQEFTNTRVPRWLFVVYLTLPFWGFYTMYEYWDGSHGWLDRGYWHELQVAANTTASGEIRAEKEAVDGPKIGSGLAQ